MKGELPSSILYLLTKTVCISAFHICTSTYVCMYITNEPIDKCGLAFIIVQMNE